MKKNAGDSAGCRMKKSHKCKTRESSYMLPCIKVASLASGPEEIFNRIYLLKPLDLRLQLVRDIGNGEYIDIREGGAKNGKDR